MRASGRTALGSSSPRGLFALLTILIGTGGATGAVADVRDPFPEIRPSNRSQAIDFLLPRHAPEVCEAPRVEVFRPDRELRSPARARALALLQTPFALDDERTLGGPDGVEIRFAAGLGAAERELVATAREIETIPGTVQAVLRGIEQARALLVRSLELPAPEGLEVVLTPLRPGLDGYLLGAPNPTTPADSLTLVLNPELDRERARRAAMAGYARAVALTADARFPAAWSDALAGWTSLSIDGLTDEATAACLSTRAARLADGVATPGERLGRGNALWFAFLEEAYGITTVQRTVEELAGGGPLDAALDRGLRRTSTDDLQAALREFHVWTVLVGDRADAHHFPFAGRLASPEFASTSRGVPALSVQSDPAVASTGLTQIALRPNVREGGLRILFEGELGARWDVDLLLLRSDGKKHRLALPLDEGRGEKTVPADGLVEAWMLIRNLGDADAAARRYSYSAHHEQGFPFELADLSVTRHPETGVLVAWETDAEFELFGYNIVRVRDSGGQPVIVNPIWVPALGQPGEATSYRFHDRSAEPGVAYRYRIQGITRDGLTSQSDAVVAQPARP